MGAANHRLGSATTYPFNVMGGDWRRISTPHIEELPHKGDTVVGNDVWFGRCCTVLPGVKIGDGAIVAACSVVANDVAPYTVVGGNPAHPLKKRFDDETVALLERLRWWDLPARRADRPAPCFMRHQHEERDRKAARLPCR